MKRHWIASLAALAAGLGVSACAVRPEVKKLPSTADTVELVLIVDGVPLEQFLADPEKTREVLADFEDLDFASEKGRADIRGWLARIDQGVATQAEVPDDLSGVAGFSTALLARAVLFPKETRRVTGLIGDYYFDRATGRGHLTVDMKTEIFDSPQSLSRGVADRTHYLHWHIDVLEGGFNVHTRKGSVEDPDDPFPGTVKFPEQATDPDNEMSIWARGLDHKLFAKGKVVVVRDVYQRIDDGPITRLPDDYPFYKSTDESCIDLLTRGYPPAFRIDLPEQSGYCLGRCEHPYVINTM